MPNVAQDVRSMFSDFGESVTLTSGAIVRGILSVASVEDSMLSNAVISGQTMVLRLASADVPGLVPTTSTLTFRGVLYGINHVQLTSGGNITRAFLGAP
jgi:hypothetical protein